MFHPSSKVACQIQIVIKYWEDQHQAEERSQYGWKTAACLLQKELPVGCGLLCYWEPDRESDRFCVVEDTNVGQWFSCTFWYIPSSATTSFSMLLEISAWSPQCKIHHPKCTPSHSNQDWLPLHWSMSSGKTPMPGSAALTYSGIFCTGPGAAGPVESSRCCQWYQQQHRAAPHGYCIRIPNFCIYGAPFKTVLWTRWSRAVLAVVSKQFPKYCDNALLS